MLRKVRQARRSFVLDLGLVVVATQAHGFGRKRLGNEGLCLGFAEYAALQFQTVLGRG